MIMRSPRRAAIALLAAGLYAFCYVVIKAGLPYAPPLRFAAQRALLAGVTLLVALGAAGRPLLPPRRLWRGIVVIATIGTAAGFAAMALSPGRSGAGLASVLGNTTPLLVVLIAAVVLDERVTRVRAMALALGFAGTAIIAVRAGIASGTSNIGGALIPLAAAAASATESVAVKRLAPGDAALRVAAWQLLLGSLPLFAVSAWVEGGARTVWSPRFVGLLGFIAVFGTALATSLWYWLVQRDDVGHLSLYLFFVPVLGLALGVALFDERLGLPELAGVALTLTGIAVAMHETTRPARPGRDARGAAVKAATRG